jgi:hypothetical protein
MRKEIILLFLFVLFVPLVSSEVQVQFEILDNLGGDTGIAFSYSISSNINDEISFFVYSDCPDFSREKMDLFENVSLGSSSFNGTYNYAPLEQVGNIQNCKAVVRILKFDEPFTQSFVFNPTPIFDFSIKLDKKVFIQDEQIVLDYDSSVGDLIVSTNLIFPDGSSDEVEFPYEVVNKQIGTYELQVTASKEGYKTISLDEQFGVIGQDAEVQGADFSKEGLGKVERERDYLFWSIFGFILIVLVVIVFFVYRKILKQR